MALSPRRLNAAPDGCTLLQLDSEHLPALPCHSPEVPTVGEAAGPAGFESITWSPTEIRRNADLKFKTYEQLVKLQVHLVRSNDSHPVMPAGVV